MQRMEKQFMQKNRKLSESVSFLALKWAYTEVVIHDIKTCLVCLQVLNHEVFYLWYLTVKETHDFRKYPTSKFVKNEKDHFQKVLI